MVEGHAGPITGVSCHAAAGSVDLSHLYLTCSMDWSVKLWTQKVHSYSIMFIQLFRGLSTNFEPHWARNLKQWPGDSYHSLISRYNRFNINTSLTYCKTCLQVNLVTKICHLQCLMAHYYFYFIITQENKALYSFEDSGDYVVDVRWSPTHPALFAAADASGRIDLWNLNRDTEVCSVILLSKITSKTQCASN